VRTGTQGAGVPYPYNPTYANYETDDYPSREIFFIQRQYACLDGQRRHGGMFGYNGPFEGSEWNGDAVNPAQTASLRPGYRLTREQRQQIFGRQITG